MDARHDLVVPVRIDRARSTSPATTQAIGRLRQRHPRALNADAQDDPAPSAGSAAAGMSLKMMEDARLGPNAPAHRRCGRRPWEDLWVVMATIGIVLLIAANVANLMPSDGGGPRSLPSAPPSAPARPPGPRC
jgi:hypothetical protein